VGLSVFDKITPFDGHSNLYRYLLKKSIFSAGGGNKKKGGIAPLFCWSNDVS
jgi:hypothetical protein